ncbi:MAG TPA: GDP-mannose 4,6-dehydratase [Candidatus Pacearchaeota archaeon]|nr:GDP-mannose 4,6-dehydratase [Candidatus Pacearchaeota archaeon]
MKKEDGLEKKVAIITGITGQDGSYLAKFLLEKGYEVYGMHRRTSMDVFERIGDLRKKITLVEGDVTDMSCSILRLITEIHPDEIYNLAGQSFVPDSWTQSISTLQINAGGVLNILETIKNVDPKIKFYQASTSEMFGQVKENPQTENTPFNPQSPYASAKLCAYNFTKNFREGHNIFACNGILFNHESPRRGKQFVTRKISHSVAKIKMGYQDYFEIGNLDAKRDWGFAGDYVEAMWLMLQQDKPDDYVIGTGETHSVREFIEEAFKTVEMPITWEGRGVDEIGKYNEKVVVKINPKFYRTGEVEYLLADPSKAKKELGWEPKTHFKELVKMMIESDLENLLKHGLLESDKSRLDKNGK